VADIQLFLREKVVGIFRGFQHGGLEFHADLVLPYRSEFQNIPMHGQFLLVQLETPDEAVLGRIASFSSEGKLSFGSGEEFNIRTVKEDRPIPEDLREQYLKYWVNIRVLGVLRKNGKGVTFVAFATDLHQVWRNVENVCAENAQMVIRFGSIASRCVDSLRLIKSSLSGSGWKIMHIKQAGSASWGKRQADTFLGEHRQAIEEYDVWAIKGN
jgi:hypothetical protein